MTFSPNSWHVRGVNRGARKNTNKRQTAGANELSSDVVHLESENHQSTYYMNYFNGRL